MDRKIFYLNILMLFIKLDHICMKNFGNGNFSFDMINMRTYHKVMGHSNSGVRLGSNPITKNKFIYLPFIIFEIEIIMIPASSFDAVTNSVHFSRSVVSNSLPPHGLQHTKPPCPSPTPRVYSNSCPSSRWCHPTILFSVVPFFSHLQSFQAPGPFQMSQFFASGGQSIGVSASASFQWMPRTDLL